MSAKFLSKKLKEASKNKNIRAKRLTSPHRLMRNYKAEIITSFFDEVKTLDLRNQMSQYIYDNRLEFYHHASDFVKNYQQFHKQCKYLGSWSVQSMYSEVGTKYVTMFNHIFNYSIKKFIYKWYHEGKKFNKPVEKPYRTAAKSLLEENIDLFFDNKECNFDKLNAFIDCCVVQDNDSEPKLVKLTKLSKVYGDDYDRAFELTKKLKNIVVENVKLIEFNDFSVKIAKPSMIIKDETNSLYKWWYKLCINKKSYYFPLLVDEKYLGPNLKMNVCHHIRFDGKKLIVTIHSEEPDPVFKEQDKIIGVDVNIKHNMLSVSDGKVFDYDRTIIKKLAKLQIQINKLNKSDLDSSKKQLQYNNLARRFFEQMKHHLHDFFNYCEENNVTDIVMEDLSTFEAGNFVPKSAEFNLKYTKLTRMLRLSRISELAVVQGEKRGIRVHLTPSYYTSKCCEKCGCIDDKNRIPQEVFSCVKCGHTMNADLHAAMNILDRYVNLKLRNSKLFHVFGTFGRMQSRSFIAYKQLATELSKCYSV